MKPYVRQLRIKPAPAAPASERSIASAALDVLVSDLAMRIAETVIERVALLLAEHSPAPPELLDRSGLAKMLNCSLPTVDRLRAEGLPEVTIGDAPRFEVERVIEWLRRRKV